MGGDLSNIPGSTPPCAEIAGRLTPPAPTVFPPPPPPPPPPGGGRLPAPGSRGRCQQPHTLARGVPGWSSLLACKLGGHRLHRHNAIAGLLASLAPRSPPAHLGVPSFPTAHQPAIGKILAHLGPGRSDWARPDVFTPAGAPDGRPVLLDITIWNVPVGAALGAKGALGAVEDTLTRAEATKARHYASAGCTGPGGPMAPGTANYRSFPLLARGRLGATALATLREWSKEAARVSVGAAPDDDVDLRLRASVILRSYFRVISTTVWRLHASRLHEAAVWLAEDLASSAAPVAATPFLRDPPWSGAPSVGDLPCHPLGLADLDEAGLQLASAALEGHRVD